MERAIRVGETDSAHSFSTPTAQEGPAAGNDEACGHSSQNPRPRHRIAPGPRDVDNASAHHARYDAGDENTNEPPRDCRGRIRQPDTYHDRQRPAQHRPPRHRPKRRLDPAQLLEPIVELPDEERLELYATCYRALADRAGRRGDMIAAGSAGSGGVNAAACPGARRLTTAPLDWRASASERPSLIRR